MKWNGDQKSQQTIKWRQSFHDRNESSVVEVVENMSNIMKMRNKKKIDFTSCDFAHMGFIHLTE